MFLYLHPGHFSLPPQPPIVSGLENCLFRRTLFFCAEPPHAVTREERVGLPHGVLVCFYIGGIRGIAGAVLAYVASHSDYFFPESTYHGEIMCCM